MMIVEPNERKNMRDKHTFQFSAGQIAEAAKDEAAYHSDRVSYWKGVLERCIDRVKDTAEIQFEEVDVTGGKRLQVSVKYGDQLAYQKMSLAYGKIDSHRAAAERFETDARVYGSQSADRVYDLDTADVHYYRLGGNPRDE
jgi:hypothetical protein